MLDNSEYPSYRHCRNNFEFLSHNVGDASPSHHHTPVQTTAKGLKSGALARVEAERDEARRNEAELRAHLESALQALDHLSGHVCAINAELEEMKVMCER